MIVAMGSGMTIDLFICNSAINFSVHVNRRRTDWTLPGAPYLFFLTPKTFMNNLMASTAPTTEHTAPSNTTNDSSTIAI